MPPTAIDHVIIAAADLEAACEPWRRLGLLPAYGTRHKGQGTENAVIFLGDTAENMFYLEFLAAHDRAEAAATARGRRLLEAIDAGGGLFRIVLETADLPPAVRPSEAAGTPAAVAEVFREDGSKICDVLSFHGDAETSSDPRLVRYVTPRADRFRSRQDRRLFGGTFPLARLDHLALVPPDMEATPQWWAKALGVRVVGEVRGPGIRILQLKVGDAIVEFLGADGPDSRLAGAAPGLRSMVAFEVDDLQAAVDTARERGFTPSSPGTGILPGTRTATIPATELSGVTLQLLEYV